ncbi:jg23537, partial [Pararge aegeria aegeria]
EYESKSLEELRFEDYAAGRKGASGGMFGGGFGQQTENKPLFGGSTFGQPATTSAQSLRWRYRIHLRLRADQHVLIRQQRAVEYKHNGVVRCE